MWRFTENFLINLTYSLRLSFQEIQYSFKLRKQTTISKFSNLAKEKRYGKSVVLPSKLDLIEESNSETLRIKFTQSQLNLVKNERVQVLQIKVLDETLFSKLNEGFMLAAKITINKRFLLIFSISTEYSQAINNLEKGTVGKDDRFVKATIRKKSVLNLGRFKFYFKEDEYLSNSYLFV